jgi:hypothetical protein
MQKTFAMCIHLVETLTMMSIEIRSCMMSWIISRHFRRSLFGLPFGTHSVSSAALPSTSSPSLLLCQLYAISILRRPSTNTIQTSKNSAGKLTHSARTDLSSSIVSVDVSTSHEQRRICCVKYDHFRYMCLSVLLLILVFIVLIVSRLSLYMNMNMNFLSCHCPVGYESSLSSTICTCIDRNECLNDVGFRPCPGHHVQCVNTMGSYTCRCRSGYVRHDHDDVCVDVNECDLYQPCNTSISTCINLPGRYYCQCFLSQTNDNRCIPRNVCIEQADLCGPHSDCVSTANNGYNCQVRRHDLSNMRQSFLDFSVIKVIECSTMVNVQK